MRIAFIYPPFTKGGKYPNLPQNRQFIYTASDEVKLYPVIMAQAATYLKNLGHEILWLDGITRRLAWQTFEEKLASFSPDLIILETKTPMMPQIWKLVNKWKMENEKRKIVLVGDHVTYFPEESYKKSRIDFVLRGGDYDYLLVDLINKLGKEKKNISFTGIIDRNLTCWKDYGEAYLYHPCAYVMFGRGCVIDKKRFGACTFCIWQQALWKCSGKLVTPQEAIKEVNNLDSLGVKEIFDDAESGVLSDRSWLEKFYHLLIKEKLLGRIIFSSNARGDQLDKKTCELLKKIGFRLLKVGLESGNNETLQKINKKETVEQIIAGVKNAKNAGLNVMLTVMVGYPWEGKKEVEKTYEVTRRLMLYKTKVGDCLQASLIIPYPGTILWQMAIKNHWLKIKPFDYERYDMEKPILKTKIDAQVWCQKIWSIQKEPLFILKSALTIKSADDFRLLARGAKSLWGHLVDFSKK